MTHQHNIQTDSPTIDQVAKLAKEVLLLEGGYTPTVIVEGSNSTIAVEISASADTQQERWNHMARIGFALAQQNAVGNLRQVFYIGEAWIGTAAAGKQPGYRPSRDPDRKESLVILHRSVYSSRNAMLVGEIVRDEKGNLIDLKKFQEVQEGQNPFLDAFLHGFAAGSTGAVN
jgi:hypothetical protein